MHERTPASAQGGAASPAEAELSRLRLESAFHQRFRDLTVAFSRGLTSTTGLDLALKTLTAEANQLLGARRTAVWLHDRRIRELTLSASSDAGEGAPAVRVPSDHPTAPPAQGLRLERPGLVASGADPLLLVPLRGWRRALGTVVVEGPFTDALESRQLVELAHELGRQLSGAVETVQLIEEILRQRQLLENTFDSIVDLLIVTDAAHRTVQVNEAVVSRLGVPWAELIDRPLDTLVGQNLARWITGAAGDAADGAEGVRTHRVDDSRLGGTFAVTIAPLISQDGERAGQVIIARDITRETRLELEREALRARLAQTEKLASLGQFVAGIAHEMNNPLQGVVGHLELLLATSAAARPVRRELRRILHEAARAAKIVRNLMLFTGTRRVTRRPLQVPRLLSRAMASRTAALRRENIAVTRDEPADLPRIAGDPLLLHQVFLNVLINAEHAMLSTGRERRIHVASRLEAAANRIVTTIRDTGPGIPPDVLPRIFDPFFTTKDVGQGTGLGLALAYGIVQDHGGAIYAENAPEGGAILTIELPVWTNPDTGQA